MSKRRYLFKLNIIVLFICIIVMQDKVVASNGNYTESFGDYGLDYIEIDADYAVITRTGIYNTITDGEKTDAELLQERMTTTNTYICAIPSSLAYEVNIDFKKQDEYFDISLLKDFSEEEVLSIFTQDFQNGTNYNYAKYKEINGNIPAIEVEAYISNMNQYLYGYACSAKGKNGYYTVFFKLYTYGRPARAFEKKQLNNIINNSQITISETGASKQVYKDVSLKTLEKALKAALSGGLLAAMILAWKRFTSKKDNRSKEDKLENDADFKNEITNNSFEIRNSKSAEEKITYNLNGAKNDSTSNSVEDNSYFQEKNISIDEMHLFCRKCGSELPLDSEFCNKCGTKVIRL